MAEIKKYLDTVALGALVDQIKAEDAKALAAAKAYCDAKDSQFESAGAAATAEANAKAYTDELANGQVKLNKEAIATLNGEGDGSVKKAVADAQATLQGAIDAVEDKVDANAEAIAAINNAETGALKQAKDYVDEKVADVQGEVDDLEELVGTLPEGTDATTIVEYINKKTTGIATDAALEELQGAVDAVEEDVATIKGDYLKAADKTELEGKITTAQNAADAAQGEVDALEEVVAKNKEAIEGTVATLEAKVDANEEDIEAKMTALTNRVAANETAVQTTLPKAIEDEKARAEEVEAGLEERLVEVETFFKTTEEETLDTALDTLVELQKYLSEEGAVADQMLLDIAANKKAIEDHVATDHDFAAADATLKSELEGQIALKADKTTVEGIDGRLQTAEGKITTLEGDMTQAKSDIDAVEAAVATKAEAQALTDAVATLEGADATLLGKIEVLEGKFTGEGSVEDMISDAKDEAIEAAAADAETKANAAKEAAIAKAEELNTAMDSRVDALEADTHTHTNKAELDKFVDGDKAKLDDAVAKAHEHANKAELDKVADGDVAKWNAAEQNAKDYADGLNTAMDGRMTAVEKKATDNADAIAALTKTHGEDKATLEAAIAANTSAINSFVAITAEEVNGLFA